jgi:hypothetical protein
VIKTILLIFIIFSSNVSFADDSCAYFKYCGSASAVKSSSSQSSPSMNPSNVARIKGLGLETLYQKNNPLAFSIVTGTGKIGGALISSTLENSFFGNRSLELDTDYFYRLIDKKRYRNKKISAALGIKISEKKNFDLDIGFTFKRNPDVRKINPGFGFSTRIGFMSLGAHVFKDDVKLNLQNYTSPYSYQLYSSMYNSATYEESFLVKSLTMGFKIKSFTLDIGYIQTKYDFYPEDTNILIYSGAYNFKKLLLSASFRKEQSSNLVLINDQAVIQRDKKNYAYGLQYIISKHFMLGVGYNNFLLNEYSATFTVFLN